MKTQQGVRITQSVGYLPTPHDPPYLSGASYVRVIAFYRSFSAALDGEMPILTLPPKVIHPTRKQE